MAILPGVTVYYPINSQNPLRLSVRQQIWEAIPNVGATHIDQTSTMDITKFQVGSLSPSTFEHCTPAWSPPGR